jgi:hypothetical protein
MCWDAIFYYASSKSFVDASHHYIYGNKTQGFLIISTHHYGYVDITRR